MKDMIFLKVLLKKCLSKSGECKINVNVFEASYKLSIEIFETISINKGNKEG